MGAQTLLLDEDTCATNFMIRDAKMAQLIPLQQRTDNTLSIQNKKSL